MRGLALNRSTAERSGARRRGRQTINNCCLRRRFSATMPLIPPGPKSLAVMVNRWARSSKTSFILAKIRARLP